MSVKRICTKRCSAHKQLTFGLYNRFFCLQVAAQRASAAGLLLDNSHTLPTAEAANLPTSLSLSQHLAAMQAKHLPQATDGPPGTLDPELHPSHSSVAATLKVCIFRLALQKDRRKFVIQPEFPFLPSLIASALFGMFHTVLGVQSNPVQPTMQHVIRCMGVWT